MPIPDQHIQLLEEKSVSEGARPRIVFKEEITRINPTPVIMPVIAAGLRY
jgi:hypothetical protein